MPRRGYRQTAEHRAKRAVSISAAMTGRRHSAETRKLIGQGVRRAARARGWMTRGLPPPGVTFTSDEVYDAKDYLLGIVFAKVTTWRFDGNAPPGVKLITRDEFERLPEGRQRSVVASYVNDVKSTGDRFQPVVVFRDGSRWPALPGENVPRAGDP